MDRLKLNKIVEYVKLVGFYHDTEDLEDRKIDEILADYGIYQWLSDEESSELYKWLYELAEQNEFREAERFAENTNVVEGLRMVV